MGSFRVSLQFSNPDNGHSVPVNALVDTGAIYSMIPASMLRRMGIAPIAKAPFIVAAQEVVEYETGEAVLTAVGRRRTCPVTFGPENHFVMGATALAFILLAVDPLAQRLPRRKGCRCHLNYYRNLKTALANGMRKEGRAGAITLKRRKLFNGKEVQYIKD